ncbi:hypothetical protein [Desulfonema magnum]|uniref:Uncharacterized protein n=1 Tax=Desulfonema magnum TaxID=45655 RepID=A0A975BTH7_9BACT|nr:hypothetical protein [Desulfonema magnum]QTA91217.1 Uncharacterized protein dnm_072810 [Desulfonema magnum]
MELRAFVAKKGTAKRLRETSCLRAFVAKKGTAKRLRETSCLRGKKTGASRLLHIKPVLV